MKRTALDAHGKRDNSSAEVDQTFENGLLTARYEVFSLMPQQAVAFGIGLDELAFDDIDSERDLP